MSRFDFLGAPNIAQIESIEERDTLIEGFLLEKSINILWGKSGLGKTWLCFGLCKLLAAKGCDMVYLDADNGIDLVKDRGYDKVIKELNGKMTYINADFLDEPKSDMDKILKKLEENTTQGYKKAIFILDSLTFFLSGSVYDEAKIDRLIAFSKRLRRAGGTLIIIAHATKSGTMFRGSSNLVNAVDELWEAEKMPSFEDELNFILTPFKKRLNVNKTGFNIKTTSCQIAQKAPSILEVKEAEQEIIQEFIKKLETKEYSQSNLLRAMGKNKGDKVHIRVLKRFDGIYWSAKEGKNRSVIYTLHKNKQN